MHAHIPGPSAVRPARHRCRNPRCGAKLARPTDNPRAAFCCLNCFESYFRRCCIVCERAIAQKTKPRRVCDRQKCRGEFRRHPERFLPPPYPGSGLSQISPGSAHSTGLKIDTKTGRPFRKVAGPDLPEINLRVPLDSEFAARLDRAHASYFDARAKAMRAAARATVIERRHPPVNALGGHRFPGAPAIDLSSIATPAWATPSRWTPTGDGAGVLPAIPDFLRRHPIALRLAA